MELRPLGRTGVQVTSLCLGCMMFGRRTSAEDSYTIIDRALDAGINFLDTANVYARGQSEEITGRALHRDNRRQRVVLATKVHGRMADDDPNARGNSRRHIIEQCEASLRRLQTDYIDLYQIHRPEASTPIDETLRALDDLVRAGKCGTSAPAHSARGSSWSRCGSRRSSGSIASSPSSRRTTFSTGAWSESWCPCRRRSASV
jgi:aryl-alcohol dehydrogenase-like predicted oxidoreductase